MTFIVFVVYIIWALKTFQMHFLSFLVIEKLADFSNFLGIFGVLVGRFGPASQSLFVFASGIILQFGFYFSISFSKLSEKK
jgi:hypothetical protein